MDETPLEPDFEADLRLLDMWAAGEVEWDDLPEDLREEIASVTAPSEMEVEVEEMPSQEAAEFAKSYDLIHKSNSEQRFTLGPWYIPNRYDAHGEWTDAEELQKALWDYVRTGDRRIRLQHNREVVAGEWLEALSFPVPVTIDMKKDANSAPVTYPSGTVFLGVQWKPWAWELVKQGKIRGFSIGGAAARVEMGIPDEMTKAAPSLGSGVKRVPSDPVLWSRLAKSVGADVESVYVKLGGTFRDLTPAQMKLAKMRFASRSDAARYAANMRWQNLRGQVDRIVKNMKMVDGRPPRGPIPMPRTADGMRMRAGLMSMDGHVDFDAAAETFKREQPEKFARAGKLAEDTPYDIIRRHMTPERRALHDAIVNSQFEGKVSRGREVVPTFVYLGGGPAAGKSTMLRSGDATVPTRDANGDLKKGAAAATNIEVGADEYKSFLPEFEALRRGKGSEEARRNAAEDAHEESSMIGKAIQARALQMRLDIVVDGLGDGGKQADKIIRAKAKGYRVEGLYATVPIDLAVERAEGRGAPVGTKTVISDGSTIIGEGRYLSPKLVAASHAGISGEFMKFQGFYDKVQLFDTRAKGSPVLVYSRSTESTEAGIDPVVDGKRMADFRRKGLSDE